jgi:hypothetical protein
VKHLATSIYHFLLLGNAGLIRDQQYRTDPDAGMLMPGWGIDQRGNADAGLTFPRALQHSWYDFSTSYIKYTTNSSRWNDGLPGSFQTGFGITKSPMPEPFRYRNAPMPDWDAVRQNADARQCHFRFPAIPFSERKFKNPLQTKSASMPVPAMSFSQIKFRGTL